MRSALNLRAVFSLLLLSMPLAAMADGFTRGVFQLFDGQLENQYEFIAEYPVSVDSQQQIIWPKTCRTTNKSRYQSDDTITLTYLIQCDAPLEIGDAITVPYKLDTLIFESQLNQWQSKKPLSPVGEVKTNLYCNPARLLIED